MPRRRITLRQLETFAEVARWMSFTVAAEKLHLTQPAVSIQVRQIAEHIGLPVFEQHGREIALTAAGRELLATVRNLDDAWNRFESAIADLKGFKRGSLRVALVTTAKHFLPRMLGKFYQRYPDIEIELEIANREKIVERIRNNQDDLYVMSLPPQELDIVSYPFLDNEFVVLAPQQHWAVGRPCRLSDLAAEPFLLRETGSGSRHVIDDYLHKHGIALNVRLSLSSNEAIRDLVASGMGLTVLSRQALPDNASQLGLVELTVKDFPLRRTWSVLHLRTKILSLPSQAFLAELLKSGSEQAAGAGR